MSGGLVCRAFGLSLGLPELKPRHERNASAFDSPHVLPWWLRVSRSNSERSYQSPWSPVVQKIALLSFDLQCLDSRSRAHGWYAHSLLSFTQAWVLAVFHPLCASFAVIPRAVETHDHHECIFGIPGFLGVGHFLKNSVYQYAVAESTYRFGDSATRFMTRDTKRPVLQCWRRWTACIIRS